MSLPSIKTDFDYVFGEYVVEEYGKTYNLGEDELFFDSPINFVYYTKVRSLEELKISYNRIMKFISFVSEKYPILIDVGLMKIRMDIESILVVATISPAKSPSAFISFAIVYEATAVGQALIESKATNSIP